MAISQEDKRVVRDLAQEVAAIAALPEQQEKRDLWRRLNGLERVRPMVMLQNGTWFQTGDQIQTVCEDEWARGQEWNLRAALYHWQHMRDDTLYQARVFSPIVMHHEGYGIGTNATAPDHIFGARHYNTVLADDADPTVIPIPTVTIDHEATETNYQRLAELYDGVFEVEKIGVRGGWFAIMDLFIQWRGLEKTFTDMCDRPEWVHAWMDRMTAHNIALIEQFEELGVLALNNGIDRVGPGGFVTTDDLPQPDFDGVHVRARDMWGHATTQIFSEVSPAMHDEFALTYEKRYLERFGLASYGCCEPLDRKMDIIKKIKNLRRVSMSPWVDPARGAAELNGDYIFSYKPNPAIIGMEAWDAKLAEDLLRDVLEKTRGCVVEVIMKDLHECRGEPSRMWEWVDLSMRLAEEYA